MEENRGQDNKYSEVMEGHEPLCMCVRVFLKYSKKSLEEIGLILFWDYVLVKVGM